MKFDLYLTEECRLPNILKNLQRVDKSTVIIYDTKEETEIRGEEIEYRGYQIQFKSIRGLINKIRESYGFDSPVNFKMSDFPDSIRYLILSLLVDAIQDIAIVVIDDQAYHLHRFVIERGLEIVEEGIYSSYFLGFQRTKRKVSGVDTGEMFFDEIITEHLLMTSWFHFMDVMNTHKQTKELKEKLKYFEEETLMDICKILYYEGYGEFDMDEELMKQIEEDTIPKKKKMIHTILKWYEQTKEQKTTQPTSRFYERYAG